MIDPKNLPDGSLFLRDGESNEYETSYELWQRRDCKGMKAIRFVAEFDYFDRHLAELLIETHNKKLKNDSKTSSNNKTKRSRY